jgi:hypothetical protein
MAPKMVSKAPAGKNIGKNKRLMAAKKKNKQQTSKTENMKTAAKTKEQQRQ